MESRVPSGLEPAFPLARGVPPLPAVNVVRRDRLESLVSTVLQTQLTLVTGPGGYGKTTLLLAWHEALRRQVQCAWITLSADEASLSALAHALATVFERPFSVRAGADARAYATALANELFIASEESGSETVLFVDDVHSVIADAETQRYFTALLQALPRRVHVVLASRHALEMAPIAKLRNAGRLLEVNAADLRFRPEEASLLLRDRGMAQAIVERTDGWAIAVRSFATLAAAPHTTIAGELPAVEGAVFAFLAQEVMCALDADLRDMLGPLAIPAAIDASTVDYLLERTDGAAIIARLVNRSLYIERAEDGSWRLHQLFREYLLETFKRENPAREREARRRYATLLRERGDKVGAFEQVIETGDLAEIVEYARSALLAIQFTDRYRRLLELFAQVPDDVKRRKPVLYRLQATAMQRAGHWHSADAQLQACYDAATANSDTRTACMALIDLGVAQGRFRFRMHGRHEASLRCFSKALELAESPELYDTPAYRKIVYEVLGLTHALRFEYDVALQWLRRAEQLELAEQSHADLLFVELARVAGWMGDWRRSLEYAELAEELFRVDAPYHLGYALIVEAKALVLLAEDPAHALSVCAQAVESLRVSFEDEELGAAYAVQAEALLAVAEPDFLAVRNACAQAEQFLDPRNAVGRCEVALLRAQAAARRDDRHEYETALRSARRFANDDPWLTARVALIDALTAFEDADFRRCVDQARSSHAAFVDCGDRFNLALSAVLHAAACAKSGTLTLTQARDTLAKIADAGNQVLVHVKGPFSHFAVACLRQNFEPSTIETAAGASDALADEDLYLLARSETVCSESRLVALRLLLKRDSDGGMGLLRELAASRDSGVATSASRALFDLPAQAPAALTIDVISELRVTLDGQSIADGDARWGRKKAAELLRLLAVTGAPVTKTAAIAALWPDADKGREVTLRVVVHALRRALQPQVQSSDDYVTFDGTTVALNRARIALVDSEQALARIARGKHLISVGQSASAERELLAGLNAFAAAPKEADAAPWLAPHVRRWRTAVVDGLRALAQLQRSQNRPDEAVATIRHALALDSLDESSVVLALEIFRAHGALAEGRTLYNAYKRRLADVLDAAPSAEVTQSYTRLLQQRREVKRTDLSERELEIMERIASGQTSKDIAAALELSVFTVNNHVGRILKKLGVESRAAAVARIRGNDGSTE